MNHFDDSQISAPVNFGGKIAYDDRPQPRNPNQQSFPDLGFKRPRPRIPLSVNRSKLSIPYKSELCLLFQRRKCYYGENCHYAHNPNEIRRHNPHRCDLNVGRDEAGLNRMSGRGDGDWIECRNLRSGGSRHYKTRLCAKWVERSGSCPYGEKCTYAHGIEELQEPGYYAELESRRDSRLMLGSRPSFTGSCKIGIETAKEEGGVHIMEWDIAKISQIYADWVGVGHDQSNTFRQEEWFLYLPVRLCWSSILERRAC